MVTLATTEGARDEHIVVPMPGSSVNTARLCFDDGLEQFTVRSDDTLTDLLDASFGTPLPTVWADGANVHIGYPIGSRLLNRSRPSTLALNPTVPWALDVHGGAQKLDADLTDVDVRSVTFHSGVAGVRLVLDRPPQNRVIRLTSVRDLRIERPADVPVRLEAAKGVTKVRLDDRWFGAVGNGLTQATHASDAPGYRLVIAGGADTVTVEAT